MLFSFLHMKYSCSNSMMTNLRTMILNINYFVMTCCFSYILSSSQTTSNLLQVCNLQAYSSTFAIQRSEFDFAQKLQQTCKHCHSLRTQLLGSKAEKKKKTLGTNEIKCLMSIKHTRTSNQFASQGSRMLFSRHDSSSSLAKQIQCGSCHKKKKC